MGFGDLRGSGFRKVILGVVLASDFLEGVKCKSTYNMESAGHAMLPDSDKLSEF